jgi:hypothetical protein
MTRRLPPQAELFAAPTPLLPEGMIYQPEFLDAAEEAHWIEVAASLPLKEMNYRGYTARRRVASYGGKYDFSAHRLEPSAPLPAQLEPLRAKAAAWLGVAPEAFTRKHSLLSTAKAHRWAGIETFPISRMWSACRCWAKA